MFILIDLLFVLLLFSSIYLAGKKGLVGQLRGLLVLVAAAVLAFSLCSAFAHLIGDTTLGGGIYDKVEASIGSLLGISADSDSAVAEGLIANENATITAIDALTSVDLLGGLRAEISAGADNLAAKLLSVLAEAVTGVLLRVISFLVIFFLAFVGLHIAIRALKRATEQEGFAGTMNLWLGLTFGTLRGLVLCIILGNVGEWLIASLGATRGWDVAGMLADTYLFRFFSNIFVFL